jgi:hypothetical protein
MTASSLKIDHTMIGLPCTAAPPRAVRSRSFLGRNGQYIVQTVAIALLFSALIPFWIEPTYRAVAHVVLPPGADTAVERFRIISLTRFARAQVAGDWRAVPAAISPQDVPRLIVQAPRAGGDGLDLVVYGDGVGFAAAAADSWADSYAADADEHGRGPVSVTHARVSDDPIAPNRVPFLLGGLVVGLLLGLAVAVYADGPRRWKP